MKKLLITLGCLLVIALYGTYAYNQNLFHRNSNSGNSADIVVTQTPYQSGQLITDNTDNTNTTTPIANTPTIPPTNQATITKTPTPSVHSAVTITNIPNKPVATPKPSVNSNNTTTTGNGNFANEVLRLVNVQRSKAGLPLYKTTQTLSSAASKRAQEINRSFSHTRPNGTGFSTVLKEYGISYTAAGENIASGQRTPQEVVNAWMKSPGHRANILNVKFKKIGIGVYKKSAGMCWTQEFTN